MKKFFLCFFILIFSKSLNAQIVLEQSYPDKEGLSIIKLENSGEKYLQYDIENKKVKLYNLNHSIYKTINLPAMLPDNSNISISYISEKLFNTDSKIEILCHVYSWDNQSSNSSGSVKIINEDGDVLFSEDSMKVVPQRSTTWYGYDDKSSFIYSTATGVKMILYSYKTGDKGFKVYSLPGTLLTSVQKPSIKESGNIKAYPNPSSSEITIAYDLPGNTNATLTIFDSRGRELDHFLIDNTFDNVLVDVSKYKNGIYLYSIKENGSILSNGKFVVSK